MTKKYIGKLKSWGEIKKELKSVDNLWDIDFVVWLNDNEQKYVILKQFTDCSFDNGEFIFTNNLFSEIKEIEQNEVWKPKDREQYYSVRSCGDFYLTELNNESEYEKGILKSWGCWKTKEEAETVEKSMKLYRAMKRWSFDNDNGYEFIQGNSNFCLHYNTRIKIYEVSDWVWLYFTMVCFSSKEKAEQCLKWLKEEKLI